MKQRNDLQSEWIDRTQIGAFMPIAIGTGQRQIIDTIILQVL